MKKICCCLLLVLSTACIPLRIAPTIKGEKIASAKKFKKDLPNLQGFIFKDTKRAYEFYKFIDTKYDLKHVNVDSNVPIKINNVIYYLSFFEREKTTETLNLIPILIDAHLESKGNDPLLEGLHGTRSGYWYLVLTVTDNEIKDCLNANYPQREQILHYLKKLKNEYYATSNYMEAYLKMKLQ